MKIMNKSNELNESNWFDGFKPETLKDARKMQQGRDKRTHNTLN